VTPGCAPSWAEVDTACARLLAADRDTVGWLSTHELRELAFERYVDEQRAALAGHVLVLAAELLARPVTS